MRLGKPVICFDVLKISSISVSARKYMNEVEKGKSKIIKWEIN